MILEVADIRVVPGRQADFERAAHQGIQTVIARSKGFRGYQVRRSIESPERFLLLLEWDTLEDHTVGFRGSPAHAQWRGIVAEFFAAPPSVEHFNLVPATGPGPGMALDAPIQDFSNCHVGIAGMLEDLQALVRQQQTPATRRDVAGRALGFFRDVVAAHHREEELDLFPAVLADAADPRERATVQSHVDQLTREHRQVEDMLGRLAPTLSTLARGREASLDADAVQALVQAYRAHARFEEEVFLPLAQSILGRNGDHMAALGLTLHIRHASADVRQRYGFL